MNEFSGVRNRIAAEIGVLIVLLLVLMTGVARAATPLPPAPAQGWCYVTLTTAGYQDVNACANTPPPPVDPGAYTTSAVTWLVHGSHITRTTDVTQFWNVWGHIDPSLPVQGWPGASGTTVQLVDNSTRYFRLRLTMPLNPGTLSHFLTAASYGKSPANLRARFAVVPAGAPWPTGPDTPCFKSSKAFDDSPALNINPGVPNTSKCSVAAGSTVDILIETIGNGTAALAWN